MDHARRFDRAAGGADGQVTGVRVYPRHRRSLVDRGAQSFGSGPQPPRQPGRVDEREVVVADQAAEVGRGPDAGLHLFMVKHLDVVADLAVSLGPFGDLPEVPGLGCDIDLGGATEVGTDAVPLDGGLDAVEILTTQPDQAVGLVGPVGDSVVDAVGQVAVAVPAVARAGAKAAALRLEHRDRQAWLVLERLDGGPETAEPSAPRSSGRR